MNKLKLLTNEMEYLKFEGELQAFDFFNNQIIYLTSQ